MERTEDIYPHFVPYDPQAFQTFPIPQPTTILQQLPATVMPSSPFASIRPGGHVKEDLVEMMMIQNAQMHQVIMNNMTMSALRMFGYPGTTAGPELPRDVLIIQENEADPQVYHHYYQPAPYISYPACILPRATLDYQEDSHKSGFAPQHRDRPAVPPLCPSCPAVAAGANATVSASESS